jgi:hypothetical protein
MVSAESRSNCFTMLSLPNQTADIKMALFNHSILRNLFLLVILSGALISCKSKPTADTRSKDQLGLIKIVKFYRDGVDRSAGESDKALYLESGIINVKKHITDTLQLKFSGWDARVLDNVKSSPDQDAPEITYGMSIDDFNLEEKSRYKSIVLGGSLSNTGPAAKSLAEQLEIGDHVQLSGSFITRDKRIDVDPYNLKNFRDSKNIFANPEFRVEITEIKIIED